jgi:hypothetical protein
MGGGDTGGPKGYEGYEGRGEWRRLGMGGIRIFSFTQLRGG